MFATITALVMAAGGLGLGATSLVISSRASSRLRAQQALIADQMGLVVRETVKHSTAMAAAQDIKASQVFSELAGRLEGLEFAATEQLITRDEVSAAFAELARIEEQRLRQQQVYGAGTPTPVAQATAIQGDSTGQRAADPWTGRPPSDPAALVREIAEMNERLKQRLQSAGQQG